MSNKSRIAKLEAKVQKLEESLNDLTAITTEKMQAVQVPAISPRTVWWGRGMPMKIVERVTLRGEVDAILEHLKLSVSVGQKKCTAPKIVTKVTPATKPSRKPTKAKKGR